MFTHIDVSRRPHCAVHNLTGATPSSASPDARHPPPQGTQEAGRTPGKHAPPSLAGARHRPPGTGRHGRGPRTPPGCLRARLTLRDRTSPPPGGTRLAVGVAHDGRPTATAVAQWWTRPPRLAWRWWPTSCPRAKPRERACGAGHDKGTRNPKRKRVRDVGQDGEPPRRDHGPWPDNFSPLSQVPEVTAAVEHRAREAQAKLAACVYESRVG